MKLSLTDIKPLSNQRSFSNAMMLVEDNEVTVNDVIKSSNINQITTYSMNYTSMYQTYKVSIKVDRDNIILAHSCDCLAHEKYGGLCKHLIALCAMSIKFERPDEFYLQMNLLEGEATYRLNKAKLNNFSSKLQEAKTLDKIVNVTPTLTYKSNYYGKGRSEDYAISVKVGTTREYVVKDTGYFLKNILFSKTDSYGKLEFNHHLDSFSEESQSLIKLLIKNGSVFSSEAQKDLPITPSFLDDLMEFYNDKFLNTAFGKEKRYLVSAIDYNLEIVLENNSLHFNESGLNILKGYMYYYVLKGDFIYKFKKPKDIQLNMLYDYLIANGSLNIAGVEEEFVSSIYPIINKKIKVSEDFKERHPILNLNIDTYFDYNEGNLVAKSLLYLNNEAITEIPNSYLLQTYNAYVDFLKGLGFTKVDNFLSMTDPKDIASFMQVNLDYLKRFGNIYLSEELTTLRIKKLQRMQISVKYNVNILEFNISNPDLSAEDVKEILGAYKKKKKFIKLKDNTIYKIDENVEALNNLLEEYDLALDFNNVQKKPSSYMLKLINENNESFIIDNKIEGILHDIRNYKQATYEIPENVCSVLRDYQKEAFYWMKTLIKYGFGGILADDMGLGKTLEVISVLMSDDSTKPSIIICPTSLVYNWTNEFKKWNSNIVCIPIIGTSEARHELIESIGKVDKNIYITSYDTLRRDIEFYQQNFRFIITDEAQFIKNQYAKKSNAVKALKSDINFSLTGTPIENGLSDLWSIFDFVMPGYLQDYNHFKYRYEQLIMQNDKLAMGSLIKKITPFILRRTKKDVLDDLPEKIESIYYTKLSTEQQRLYDSYLLKTKEDIESKTSKIEVLSLLMRLRQICVDPAMFLDNYVGESAKVEIALDLIKESINSGHKLLIFSQFTSIFNILGSRLKEDKIAYNIITGQTKSIDRLALVDEFNQNDEKKVFLISLKAGGTGLNLTGADIVIHLDPWWNVSAENQATDRAYRIGQTRNVEVIKIICADTIEQRVLELQNAKKDLADSIINNEDNISRLSKDDIRFLLS